MSHFKTTFFENLNLKCPLRNSAGIENAVDYFQQHCSTSSLEFDSTQENQLEVTRSLSREVKEKKLKKQVRTNIGLTDTLMPSSIIYFIYMESTGPWVWGSWVWHS